MLKHCFYYLAVGLMLISSPQEFKTQPTKNNGSSKQQQTDSHPPPTPLNNRQAGLDSATNAANSTENKERDAKDEAFKAEQLRQNERIADASVFVAWITGLNVAVAIVYAIIAIFTLLAIKRQAEYARDQAKSTKESVVYGLRAYVGIHSVGFNSSKTRLYIQIENVGKRPAADIKVTGEARFTVPNQPTMVVPFNRDFGKARLFCGTLRINMAVQIEEVLSAEQVKSLQAENPQIVVCGNINFMDGFHKDKNSPFALRNDRVDPGWFTEPILEPKS